ncbi:acyltransferase [Sphaerisporangium sp. NPDC051011]|uniref:acyltransferase family protein n=1 Tax=Sphaerisporangium sp. NPDC051011 TaxID=3155792 RepID=UPI0033C754F5
MTRDLARRIQTPDSPPRRSVIRNLVRPTHTPDFPLRRSVVRDLARRVGTAEFSSRTAAVRDLVRRIDAATPEGRDRGVDALRAVGILGVVLGHWLVTALVTDSGTLRVGSPLRNMPEFAPASWLLQTMAIFFLVGGHVAATSRASARTRGLTYRAWLAARMARLFRPVAAVLAVWTVVACAMLAAGAGPQTVYVLVKAVLSPLWFLLVFAALTTATPLVARLNPLWPLAVVALVDLVRYGLDGPAWIGWVNVAAGWLVPYCLGATWSRHQPREHNPRQPRSQGNEHKTGRTRSQGHETEPGQSRQVEHDTGSAQSRRDNQETGPARSRGDNREARSVQSGLDAYETRSVRSRGDERQIAAVRGRGDDDGTGWSGGRMWGHRAGWVLLLGGSAATAALVLWAGYPASMVGVPGAPISNQSPPTLAAATFGLAQCGAALLLLGPLRRVLRRPAVWAPVALANLSAMTIFLWHQTAMIAVTALGLLAGEPLPGLHTVPDDPGWLLARLAWLPAFATALLACRAAFHTFEKPPRTPGHPVPSPQGRST